MGGVITSSKRIRKVRTGEGGIVQILSTEKSKRRAKAAGSGAQRNAWNIRLDYSRDMVFDLDMRKLVEHVSLGMAAFFRRQLLAGERPDGGKLDVVRERTKHFAPRVGDQLGTRTGYMAEHWWLGKITGHPFNSSRLVKPWGGDGPRTDGELPQSSRSNTIRALLKRNPPVDFQSVRGKANAELARLFHEAVSMGFPEVRTAPQVHTQEGTLPELEGR